VNGLLNPFVGTWKGTSGNKTYEFKISKITKNDGEIKSDILIVRHRIMDMEGTLLEDTYAMSSKDVHLKGSFMIENQGGYEFLYTGILTQCGQSGTVTLSGNVNQGSLIFYFTRDVDTYDFDFMVSELGCPPNGVSYPWPIETAFTVTKQ
jgi:hypothetical protein